jgi:hypothetical protein
MQPDNAMSWASIGVYAAVIVAALFAMLFVWIAVKGRTLPGEHVFRASRLSRGNRLFPTQVIISPNSITLYKAQWIGKGEESIHMAHVASIRIDTHLFFADIFIESSGGQNPIACYGHRKSDAVRIKELIEHSQTAHYKKTPNGPTAQTPIA